MAEPHRVMRHPVADEQLLQLLRIDRLHGPAFPGWTAHLPMDRAKVAQMAGFEKRRRVRVVGQFDCGKRKSPWNAFALRGIMQAW
jgi:hypothetical protein